MRRKTLHLAQKAQAYVAPKPLTAKQQRRVKELLDRLARFEAKRVTRTGANKRTWRKRCQRTRAEIRRLTGAVA